MSARTTIDWLRFRSKAEPREIAEAIGPFFVSFMDGDCSPVTLEPLPRPLKGFQQGASINLLGQAELGRMDFGGASQRGWVQVELWAEGCRWVTDWAGLQGAIAALGGQVRRLDIALTTYAGEVTHEMVVAAQAAGLFNDSRGPKREMRQWTSTDPLQGRTAYIGARSGAYLFARCYEKGKEMAAKRSGVCTHIDGVPVEDIYRVEVEMKAVDRPIPLQAMLQTDEYFAAAYPFCARILPTAKPVDLPKKAKREVADDLEAALSHALRQFGATFRSAVMAYGGDESRLLAKIIGPTENPNLAGAVMALRELESADLNRAAPRPAHAVVRRAVAGTGAAAPGVDLSSVR